MMMGFFISDNKDDEEEEGDDCYRYGYRYRYRDNSVTTRKIRCLFLFPILLSSMILYTLSCNVMASSSDTNNSHDRSNDNTIPSSKSKKKKSKRAPPNIVILLADNLAYDDVGVFRQQLQQQDNDGGDGCSDDEEENIRSGSTSRSTSTTNTSRTHNLDKAALDGRRLLNWNSPAVLCSASRAALLTGKYPIRTGIYPRVFEPDAAYGLLPNETTLADYLHDEGYSTKIVGKWHLGQRPEYLPTKRGFDEWFGIPYHMSGGSIDDHVCGKDTTGKMWLPLFDGTSIVEQPVQLENLAPRYVEESIKFMKTNIEEKVKPFFLYLAFSHVHQLCAPRHSECQWASTHFSRNKTKGYNATFDDAVEEMDWIAGKVFDSIRELGVEGNTLVLFTSDNGPWVAEGSCSGSKGPFLGQWLADNVEQNCTACPSEYIPAPLLPDRPRRCIYQTTGNNNNNNTNFYEVDGVHCGQDTGLGSAWESNVRMPAFVKWPGGGIQSGSKTMDMVSTLDVVPTILSIVGGSENIPSDLDGIDESDVFLGRMIDKKDGIKEKDEKVIFFWRDGFRTGPLPQPFGRFDVVAMKIGPIKIWFWTKSSHYNADEEVYHDPPLLFNIIDDPAEAYPLNHPDEVYAPLIARARILIQNHKDSIDWTYPLCLDRDTKFLPCVDEKSNCRTTTISADTTVA